MGFSKYSPDAKYPPLPPELLLPLISPSKTVPRKPDPRIPYLRFFADLFPVKGHR